MSHLCQHRQVRPLSRREMLRTSAAGFGSLALAGLLGESSSAASLAAQNGDSATAPQTAFRAGASTFAAESDGISSRDVVARLVKELSEEN